MSWEYDGEEPAAPISFCQEVQDFKNWVKHRLCQEASGETGQMAPAMAARCVQAGV